MVCTQRAKNVGLDEVPERQLQRLLVAGVYERSKPRYFPCFGVGAADDPRAQRGRREFEIARGFGQRVRGLVSQIDVFGAHFDHVPFKNLVFCLLPVAMGTGLLRALVYYFFGAMIKIIIKQ